MTKFRIAETPETTYSMMKLGLAQIGLGTFRINKGLEYRSHSPIKFCVALVPNGVDIECFSIAESGDGGSILQYVSGNKSSVTYNLVMFWLQIKFEKVAMQDNGK